MDKFSIPIINHSIPKMENLSLSKTSQFDTSISKKVKLNVVKKTQIEHNNINNFDTLPIINKCTDNNLDTPQIPINLMDRGELEYQVILAQDKEQKLKNQKAQRQKKYLEKIKEYSKIAARDGEREKFIRLLLICHPELEEIPSYLFAPEVDNFLKNVDKIYLHHKNIGGRL